MANSHLRNEEENTVCFRGYKLPIVVLKAQATAKEIPSSESRYLLEISSVDPGRRTQMEKKSLNSY